MPDILLVTAGDTDFRLNISLLICSLESNGNRKDQVIEVTSSLPSSVMPLKGHNQARRSRYSWKEAHKKLPVGQERSNVQGDLCE